MNYIKQLYSGRINRKNYALGLLFSLISFLVAIIVLEFIFWETFLAGILTVVLYIAFILFVFSLHVRRFHDRGDSGWGVLFLLIPIVNLIFLALLLFERGEEKENEFGSMVPNDAKFFDVVFNKGFTPRLLENTSGSAFCHKCGESLEPNSKFCSRCGVKVALSK